MSNLAYELICGSFGAAYDAEQHLVASVPEKLLRIGAKLDVQWKCPEFATNHELRRAAELRHMAYILIRCGDIPPRILTILRRSVPNLPASQSEAWDAYYASNSREIDGAWQRTHLGWDPVLPHNEGPRLAWDEITPIVWDRLHSIAADLIGQRRPHKKTGGYAALVDAAFAECFA